MIINLPWPKKALWPNFRSRTHWAKTRAVKEYRAQCGWECKAQGVTAIRADYIDVVVTFFPPTRRHYDGDNMVAAFKAGQDGVADVIGVDDSRWRVSYMTGDVEQYGRVQLFICGHEVLAQ